MTYRRELLEETYEVINAINKGENKKIKEELGDLILTSFMMLSACEKENIGSSEEIIEKVIKKMIEKHPHVFEGKKMTEEEFLKEWEKNKKNGFFEDIESSTPSLLLAEKLSKKAARIGFDWKNAQDVLKKLEEEIKELEKAINNKDYNNIEEEIGDILFVITNLARHLNISAEIALMKVNKKFVQRFEEMRKISKQEGKELEQLSIEEMDKLWEKSKNNLKNREFKSHKKNK